MAKRLACLTLVFDHIVDPRNLSACLRVCDAFGVQDAYAVSETPPPLTGTITMSAHKWVDLHHVASNEELTARLRSRGFSLVGCVVPDQGGIPFDTLELPERLALFIGNERVGLSPELRDRCDHLVTIPMWGFVDSLNLSGAATVLLHHFSSAYRSRHLAEPLSRERREALVRQWAERDVARKLRGRELTDGKGESREPT